MAVRLVLAGRLVVSNLRHQRVTAAMLVVILGSAVAVLTLARTAGHVVAVGYQSTQRATNGPDVVAMTTSTGPAALGDLRPLLHAPGAAAVAGPFPVLDSQVSADRHTLQAVLEGKSPGRSALDQPKVTAGRWLRPGGVVVERGFAQAAGLVPGDSINVGGRVFRVVGTAVTAAAFAYPGAEWTPPGGGPSPNAGLIWLDEHDLMTLTGPSVPPQYTLDLKLADPADTEAFLHSPFIAGVSANVTDWQRIESDQARAMRRAEDTLQVGGIMLTVLAFVGSAVLVSGRVARQHRRIGRLKAVGATPTTIVAVTLVEYCLIAIIATALGLLAGQLLDPRYANPGPSLIDTTNMWPPSATTTTALGLTLLIATTAAAAPTIRAVRCSTIDALADLPAGPDLAGAASALARLPTALLIGVRIVGRRIRRSLVVMANATITTTVVTAVVTFHAQPNRGTLVGTAVLNNPANQRAGQAMAMVTTALIVVAALNAIAITIAAVDDARHSIGVARTLGTTPPQLAAGLAAAQLIPAIPGVIVGIPAGVGLYALFSIGGMTLTPTSWLVAVGAGTLTTLATLFANTALLTTRTPVASTFRHS